MTRFIVSKQPKCTLKYLEIDKIHGSWLIFSQFRFNTHLRGMYMGIDHTPKSLVAAKDPGNEDISL